MTALATAAPAEVLVTSRTVGCAVTPQDFSSKAGTDRWTAGMLRHLSAALNGRPALMVTDTMTGHTQLVVLGRPGATPNVSQGFGIVYAGEQRQTIHHIHKLGMVIPLDSPITDNPKWEAVRAYREEGMAAIRVAQQEAAPEQLTTGRWTAESFDHFVNVSWEGPDKLRQFKSYRVSLSQLS